jgi:nucleoid-associated protein EbfC
MFKEMGQLFGLMKNLPRMREEAEKLQQSIGKLNADGDAGAGMVHVRVNGKMEILSCRLSEEAMRMNDREMLEDLIRSATNQALEKIRGLIAEETSKMAVGLGLPAGMNFPGVS